MFIRFICKTDNSILGGDPFFLEGSEVDDFAPAGSWSIDTSDMSCAHYGRNCEWQVEISAASPADGSLDGPPEAPALRRYVYTFRNEV